jgi:hypothetical protein
MRDKLRPWFDWPFDMLMVLSNIEGCTPLRKVEGGSIPTAVIPRRDRGIQRFF